MSNSDSSTNEGALWGARFAGGPSRELAALSRSTHFDWVLAPYDIAGSKAHAEALHAAGYLTADELRGMGEALDALAADVASGAFVAAETDEDVHGALERGLIERAGAQLGGRLRAGRSRNDQIATLVRLYLLDHARVIAGDIVRLIDAITSQAEAHPGAILPGRTHLQHAQPVLLAHHLQAHAWPLVRDLERLRDWSARAVFSPYGGGALAGSTLGLDPALVASTLGLARPSENSMDATASRDVVAEFAFITAMIGIDLSRFAEDIIIWNTREFGFVTLDDAYSTGSSIMPQKKNADVAELARGRTGRAIAELVGILTTMKGLPMTYDRDLQEDKAYIVGASNVVLPTLRIFAAMVPALHFNLERMREVAGQSFSLATDIADYLVKKGLPFRNAHEVVGGLVREAEKRGSELNELPLEVYRERSDLFGADVLDITVDSALAARDIPGGTAPRQVRIAAAQLRAALG